MENKETFRARLKPFFSPSEQLDIKLAYTLAKFGHRAQLRKELIDGKPVRYFEHVRRVALILMDELKIMDRDMIIAALLHDSLEDTEDLTAELLEHTFGHQVATMVTLLSKIPKEGYHERLKNCNHWKAVVLKMCDRLDNLRSLMVPGVSLDFQKKQIQETKEHYIPLFDQYWLLSQPSVYQSNLQTIINEIKTLVVRYETIIELRENKEDESPILENEVPKLLQDFGWTCINGLWRTQKYGLKKHTENGLTMREAASIENIYYK